jgi:acyl carrier protein
MDIDTRARDVARRVFHIENPRELNRLAYKDHPRWDSLGHIQLMLAVEKEFGIKFTSGEMVSVRRIEDLAGAVQNGLRRAAAKTLSALGASKGGRARAKSLSKSRRREIARQAAEKRWRREGA